jgi:hypothetical protein
MRQGNRPKELSERRQAELRKWCERLSWPNYRARSEAADALGALRDPAAVPFLLAALADPDAFVRRAVTQALGTVGDPGATAALCRALNDEDRQVRRLAVCALERIGDLRALPALRARLRFWGVDLHEQPDPEARERLREVVEALEATRPFQALPIPAEPPVPDLRGLPVPAGLDEVRPPSGSPELCPGVWLLSPPGG